MSERAGTGNRGLGTEGGVSVGAVEREPRDCNPWVLAAMGAASGGGASMGAGPPVAAAGDAGGEVGGCPGDSSRWFGSAIISAEIGGSEIGGEKCAAA